ncbi:Uncharacterised protein [uncultured archaeon]|nr:Uncharacterised protein [uncultured archaeon]
MLLENIKSVLSRKNYSWQFFAVSAVTFVILSFLTLATTTGYSIEIFVMMNGLLYTVLAFIMNLAISLLFGVYIGMAAYRFKSLKASGKDNTAGVAGILAGVLSSGCPMCGSAIFGLVGAPLALMALPFQGLEIKALSIVFLGASVYLLSKNPTCSNTRVQGNIKQ